jgi:hypothetical protein
VTEPIWLSAEIVIAIHDEQLAEFGGSPGLRDEGARSLVRSIATIMATPI